MLKYLFPLIDWNQVKIVGFDLDGTLYDEFEFIHQVYIPISKHISNARGSDVVKIYNWMLRRWLEKGSSYSHIFTEALEICKVRSEISNEIVTDCIKIYRNFKPRLYLSRRVVEILNMCNLYFELFLVTDGSTKLQQAKIKSLGLNRWFKDENICVSGGHGSIPSKPSIVSLEKVDVLKSLSSYHEVLYFGDREIDEQFAINASFHYQTVYCLKSVK